MKLQMSVVFLAAVCMYQIRYLWIHRKTQAFLACVLGIFLIWSGGLQELAFTLGLPALIIISGALGTPVLRRFGRFGDISYGLYIYAYPVQQTVLWIGGASLPFWQGMILSLIITVALAALSWHWIEKPALSLKNRLRKPETNRLQQFKAL